MKLDAKNPSTVKPAILDQTLTRRLLSIALRVRRCIWLEGLAWLLAFVLSACLLDLAIDYGAGGIRWSIRLALLLVMVLGALRVAWRRLVSPLRNRLGLAEMANLVERAYPMLASRLISAVRFASGDLGHAESNSPALASSVVNSAGRSARNLDFGVVVDGTRARWSMAVLAGGLLLVGGVSMLRSDLTATWFARNILLQEVPWPKQTHLFLDPPRDELIGARGDDMVIEAYAKGVQPREVEFVFETVSGRRGRESMVTVGRESNYRYRYTFKNAQEDFTFHLEGGDDRTREFHARLLDRPRVTVTQMTIVPPAYTGLEPVVLGDEQRAAEALPGSLVTIRAQTNKPIVRASLMAGQDLVSDAVVEDGWVTASFTLMETHTYQFALLDEAGLENRRPVRFAIRMIKDDAPRVRMQLVGVGDMITPDAVLPIEVEFSDSYGLATAAVRFRVTREGSVDESITLDGFKPGLPSFSTSLAWPVSSQNVVPGELLTFWGVATDFDDVSGPHATQTPEVTLRVVTREELLAELSRREQEYRVSFERIVDAQEQVRGRLLTVLRQFQEGAEASSLSADLTPLERRERGIAGSVNVIRQQFEQNLAELRVNQLDTIDEQNRLQKGIVAPLTKLAKRDLVGAADAVRAWSRETTAQKATKIDPKLVDILVQMQSVLENMIQWEGYQEVVTMLRDIIRLQQELRAETQTTLEKEASDVFDD